MGPRRAPGPLRQRLLQLAGAALLLTRGTHALIAGPAGTKKLRTLHMENTKQEMIDAIRALLDANEKNPHCDEHWLSDLIREELE